MEMAFGDNFPLATRAHWEFSHRLCEKIPNGQAVSRQLIRLTLLVSWPVDGTGKNFPGTLIALTLVE